MIKINNLSKIYENKIVLNTINLTLPKNGVVGVLGSNGSGKTTLFKSLTGFINIFTGKVEIDGDLVIEKKINKIKIKKPFNYISYFPDYEKFYSVSVFELLEIINIMYNDFDKEKAVDIIKSFKIDLNDKIKTLSKGQKVSLNFTITVSRNVSYYILDEPFDGIDVTLREQILDNIVKYVEIENKLLVISSHEIKDIERIIDQFIILDNGFLIEKNQIDEINEDLVDYYIKMVGGNKSE